MNWSLYLDGLLASGLLATIVWFISVIKRDVSIVDSAWSWLILAAGLMYLSDLGLREWLALGLLLLWSVRLSGHITLRSWGEAEDHRYQIIRQKYSPYFAFKSLFIIFVFQAILAWIVSLPLLAIFTNPGEITRLEAMAAILVILGIVYESLADWQLMRFKSDVKNKGRVMDQGLWHYCRHPNYFGEAAVWWGFGLFALASGQWWSLLSPLLMTYLLLKFSGVTLLESTITERRPAYREYIETTNAFMPGPKKNRKHSDLQGDQS